MKLEQNNSRTIYVPFLNGDRFAKTKNAEHISNELTKDSRGVDLFEMLLKLLELLLLLVVVNNLRFVIRLELRDVGVVILDNAQEVVLPAPLLANLADFRLLIRFLQLLVFLLEFGNLARRIFRVGGPGALCLSMFDFTKKFKNDFLKPKIFC